MMRVRTVLLLLAVAVVAVVLIGGWMWWRADDSPVIASRTVLEVDLTQGFAEDTPTEAFALSLVERRPRLREVVSAFSRAAQDERVLGIIAKVGASPGGLGSLQELRDAVLKFGESGKKAMAYAETFGEFGAANGGYYLATAFDEILLQPSGDVGLTGLRYEVPFLAGTFEKFGFKPQMGQRYEFKNAVNTYTEKEFTKPHAEAMQDLVDSQFDQIVLGIAERRSLDEGTVREVFDRGPHFGVEALELGLVDGLAYRDQVYEAAESEWGEDVEYRDLVGYSRFSSSRLGGAETIALIYGVGAVTRGASEYDPLTGGVRMGADTVAQAFRDAVEDDDVRAILFRVNSPGGSYVASDTIWRETVRAREAGKPVIASFGDVAGSGGYFVAMNADRIIAQPGTITGSIGVYGGKLVSREFWGKVGLTFDAVSTSENSDM
jgi:protease-4